MNDVIALLLLLVSGAAFALHALSQVLPFNEEKGAPLALWAIYLMLLRISILLGK